MKRVTALCPTFRHPKLLANSVALWKLQDYPLEKRRLIILDDGQTFGPCSEPGWDLHSLPIRCRSISEKYNYMLDMMGPTDIVLVWEDDDLYLPGYVSAHVSAILGNPRHCDTEETGELQSFIDYRNMAEYSKPSRVLSDYPGKIIEENAAGRFHSSIAFTADLILRLGGWPDTRRADFDQQLMSKLASEANKIVDPWPTGPIPFIYRWHSGAAHCQSTMDRGPGDETWWDRAEQSYAKVPFVGKLEPKLDEFTERVLAR